MLPDHKLSKNEMICGNYTCNLTAEDLLKLKPKFCRNHYTLGLGKLWMEGKLAVYCN